MDSVFLQTLGLTFIIPIVLTVLVMVSLRLGSIFGVYVIVPERACFVYTLFGKVVAKIDEPGLHSLWPLMGPKAMIVNIFGKCESVDLRLDQEYIRSQMVNSEEGAPMGIGVWYEMFVSDPVAFLFKNSDPRGSLRSNVSNSTVRCLSNLPLAEMLTNRHPMSKAVREEVSPLSHEWGYRLGSTYIRKVHFRDTGMITQIQNKVVARLRQVTTSIRQEGSNQVNIIKGKAETVAAVEFAKAAAIRPEILGTVLQTISADAEVMAATFEVLEAQRILESDAALTLVPSGHKLLPSLLSTEPMPAAPAKA